MDDEQLRSELTSLMVPTERIGVPEVCVLRLRLRRRRGGQATLGVLALAGIAVGLNLGLSPAPAPAGSQPPRVPGACANHDLRVTWLTPTSVKDARTWAEGPPYTYRLALQNIGRAGCWLDGWPRLVLTGAEARAKVSVSYLTAFKVWDEVVRSRVVEPTRLRLKPQATALSAVTVTMMPAETGCVSATWEVRPPAPGAVPVRSNGWLPTPCFGTEIDVSAVYPSSVPLTANYPARP